MSPIDPRGPRFAAAVTTAVLIAALLLGPRWGLVPLAVQLAAFGAGAVRGPARQPYGWLFRRFVRPRLGPPATLEDPRPPRFAQAVGLGFALIALAGALVAALLNAVFDFCLGCEVYLRVQRARAVGVAR